MEGFASMSPYEREEHFFDNSKKYVNSMVFIIFPSS